MPLNRVPHRWGWLWVSDQYRTLLLYGMVYWKSHLGIHPGIPELLECLRWRVQQPWFSLHFI